MAWRWAVIVPCLLASAVRSTDLHWDRGYDPGSHIHGADNAQDPYGADSGVPRNNEWTPLKGPGPSGSDQVYQNIDGAKKLVAGSPTSPIAEAINFNRPAHIQSPPYGEQHFSTRPTYHYRQPQLSYDIESNQVHSHDGSHQLPTKTITNTIQVPVPQPYKIVIDKKVPYEVKVPVKVPVPRPVPVPVPRPVTLPVDNPYDQVIVERKVPYEVRVPVEVPVKIPYPVDVPQPYPVHIPVAKPVIVKHPVPVVIKIIKNNSQRDWFW